MTKTFKEYLGGFRIGNLDSMSPMASLGDLPPKGAGDKDSRGVGLNANKNRIPRKPGQKAGSDKHSDLYTDENPKGTIHGLGFTDAAKALAKGPARPVADPWRNRCLLRLDRGACGAVCGAMARPASLAHFRRRLCYSHGL